MDFSYTEEQTEFRRELRDWLEDNLPEGWLTGERDLPDGTDERVQFLRDWQRTLYEGNWAGVHWPTEYGGRGASLIEQSIYREELARVDSPPQINSIGINMIGPTLIQLGTEKQKKQFISHILSGEEIWCQGYSEPDAGSDVAGLTTRAERDGDEFVINGQKIWTSYAHTADWCFMVARTDFSGTKHEGLTAFLLDMDQDTITTQPIHQANDRQEFNQVYFDDAVTTEEMVVGQVDQGWNVVMTLSSFEHGITQIYDIERRFDTLLEYYRTETRNGEPLVQDQSIRQRLADLDTRIQAAKLTHFRNLSKEMERGMPGPEGSIDFAVSSDLAIDVANVAMDLSGPEAALWEDHSEAGASVHDYLQSYGMWIAGGTGDVQRNIIGEQVLDLPKDIKSKESHKE
jgi:alkylation response protein AidB-like acyl-CoA dehydrogenase